MPSRAGVVAIVTAVVGCLTLLAALLAIPAIIAGSLICGLPNIGGNNGPGSGAQAAPNSSLNQAIIAVSNGDNRLAAALWIGSHLESFWNSRAVGAGSYGPFQIQNPRDKPPVVHSGITSEQAMDPAQATNYMLPAYQAALRKLDRTDPGLWLRDPQRAAERTAYYAERPKYDYYVNRGADTVARAWTDTITLMESLKIPTSFSQAVPADTTIALPATDPAAGTGSGMLPAAISSGCDPTFTPGGPVGRPGIVSGNAVTLARRLLALPQGQVEYIYGSEVDIKATAEGKLVTPGSFATKNPCVARRPAAVSAELLQVILDIATRYRITLGSMISSHDCDRGRHPMGRAVDINFVNGIDITGSKDSFGPQHMQLYQEFRNYVASILPHASFVDGQPVNMGGLGQQQCVRPARPEQAGLNEFPDSCDHLHVDVGVAAARPSAA